MRNRKTLRISEVDFDSAVESLKEAMTELNDHYLVPKDSPKTPNAKKAQALISEALDLLRAVKFFENSRKDLERVRRNKIQRQIRDWQFWKKQQPKLISDE